ncbi:phosphomevalonate kinase [Desemzia sp. RIT804]|uniref:phosphomevalonate kinase n=1 Tax=Desemzia sp. RIT 804 TaxID=2810209 RepID=UPI001951DC30|nr:phosphomevalonate kinase [Desemzia sp. RIT 804]MBM6614590.1 phosphomevalonate kinase [Desemzia sp. RIT 804]
MITASAPGKLYIAGEYAVVEPGHPAILVAVDQFITVSLEATTDMGTILSKQYGNLPVTWKRENDRLVLDKRENPFHYILAAIEVTESYVKSFGKELSFYHLSVDSELDSSNGRKYGLGSSAAVTVATVKGILRFYGLQHETNETIFKLAALAHLSVKSNGSCGDVAASVFGGWLAFTTFDPKWVLEKQQQFPVREVIESDWPYLSFKPLTPPTELRLLIGWTGSPASTSHLVDEVTNKRTQDTLAYDEFLKASAICVQEMIHGFEAKDIPKIQSEIRRNRSLLKKMSQSTGVVIETSALTHLCKLAEKFNGAAKSSGAGGGDCGIVIFDRRDGVLSLMTAWEEQGITNLPLHVYTKN